MLHRTKTATGAWQTVHRKEFNTKGFMVLVFFALIPELLAILLGKILAIPQVPFWWRENIMRITSFPVWIPLLFSTLMGVGCKLVDDDDERKFGPNEVITFIILLPLFYWAVGMLVGMLCGLAHIPRADIWAMMIVSVIMCISAKESLETDIPFESVILLVLLTGGMVWSASAHSMVAWVSQFVFFVWGSFLAYFFCRGAA